MSTDSESYAEIAREYGADVPFLRSKENSSDKASTWDAAKEVVFAYEQIGERFDYVCVLQPTSPLRSYKNIKESFNLLVERDANSVVSVCKLEHAISICNTLSSNLSLNGFYDSNNFGRRQDAQEYYRLNGAIYIQKKNALMNKENLYGERSFAYIMDKRASIDIDDEIDFIAAEAVMKSCNGRN